MGSHYCPLDWDAEFTIEAIAGLFRRLFPYSEPRQVPRPHYQGNPPGIGLEYDSKPFVNPRVTKGGCCNPHLLFFSGRSKTLKKVTKDI